MWFGGGRTQDWLALRCHKTAGRGVRWATPAESEEQEPPWSARRRPRPTITARAGAGTTARTTPPPRSSPTATCCSPSRTRCSARPPTPKMATLEQETWLRWAGVDLDIVRDQRAYLVRITTRQALIRLRTLGRRKESYVGPWLPEPLLTAPDIAEDVELADSVSMAMLLVLETLAPTERAVFVLREVFDLAYDEIAEAVDKSPAAVRQIAHRARAHVAARRGPRRRRVPGGRPRARAGCSSNGRSKRAICRTCSTSSHRMSSSWVTVAESSRQCRAPSRGPTGPPACWLSASTGSAPRCSVEPVQVNGSPALVLRLDGEVDSVVAVRIDDGLVTGLFPVRNPHKLSHMQRETALRR